LHLVKFLTTFQAAKKSGFQNVKLIYCSFGTMPQIHNLKIADLFEKVIYAFNDRSSIFLIVACGKEYKNLKFHDSEKIFITDYAPQLTVLTHSDLAICHAGLNTVMEAIYTGTPLLVFPLNKKWDQNGNASRIIYHNIGYVGDVEKISSATISRLSSSLINNESIKNNIVSMRNKFLSYNTDDLLDNLLQDLNIQ
jgi:UDP:flavonoid glycosyltransferase YjiC (YdhE family)